MRDITREISQLQLGEDEFSRAISAAWPQVLDKVAVNESRRNVDNFLRPLKVVSYDGAVLVLGAQSSFAREWADKKLAAAVRNEVAAILAVDALTVRIVVCKSEVPAIGPLLPETVPLPLVVKSVKSAQDRNAYIVEMLAPLNDRFTFDNMIIGKSNRLAANAARAVADRPGAVYSPLFVYGDPGLGKTHLMQAIGHEIRRARPDARVAWVSGEIFTNHFVSSLKERKSDEFRRAYRSIDVLLVDDIQMIATKEQTREEFFHTFNTLAQANKQIVLASDRSPRDLRLDARLQTRFEAGLIVEVAPPDLEMRTAIVRHRAEREGVELDAVAVDYIAKTVHSSIRTLEGAVVKVIAWASMTGGPVTRAIAVDALSSYYETAASSIVRRASVDRIIETVSDRLSVGREQIVSGGRSKQIRLARSVAMYLCREMTTDSALGLAEMFGCKSHSAVVHAHSRFARELADDPGLVGVVSGCRNAVMVAT